MAKNNKKRRLHTNSKPQNSSRSHQAPKSKAPNNSSQKQHSTPTIPFDPTTDRILLIGEGDFSFAKSIVEHHGACDVVATSYDS
ncbi:Rossmann-like fold-containing protein, partial [Enterococcus faecalis]|uniref:Rossmann-like fold-containing protein n=1 Tax=Enterococcus faecalis TaxID=1351 RepID=UPI003D6B6906